MYAEALQTGVVSEFERVLDATPYGRTGAGTGCRNGYQSARSRGASGLLRCAYRRIGRPNQQSDKAFMLAQTEMYLQRISTRNVTKAVEELGGVTMSGVGDQPTHQGARHRARRVAESALGRARASVPDYRRAPPESRARRACAIDRGALGGRRLRRRLLRTPRAGEGGTAKVGRAGVGSSRTRCSAVSPAWRPPSRKNPWRPCRHSRAVRPARCTAGRARLLLPCSGTPAPAHDHQRDRARPRLPSSAAGSGSRALSPDARGPNRSSAWSTRAPEHAHGCRSERDQACRK